MKEYRIKVKLPGREFAVEWLEGRAKVEAIAYEFAGLYGPEAIVIVEREYKERERVEMKVIPLRAF